MKILMTGAHFMPALATAEELKKKNVEIVYVGRETTLEGNSAPSQESKILPSLGIKFIPITTGRLQMAFTPYTILSLLRIPVGFIQALIIVLSEKPDVILSFGGYVAVPLVIIGWLFSIPIIIHEQTLVSGLGNRISAVFADKIAISFKETKSIFNREKTILTGNPIRRSIFDMGTKGVNLPHPKAFGSEAAQVRRGVQILIMGGSQGSHVINLAVEECLDKLTKIAKVIHVTGDNKFRDFGRLQKLQNEQVLSFGKRVSFGKRISFGNENYLVKKWIDKEYGVILSKTDLVVSRAGVNTLTELAYLGKPALVIPIPYLYEDEQNKNAKYFENLGLVKILPQSRLSGDTLLKNVRQMLRDLNKLKEKAKNAKRVIIPDAAKRLALETGLLAQKA